MKKARDPNLAALLQERGAVSRIATACKLSHNAVSQWVTVPARHVHAVASEMGVAVERVLPARPAPSAQQEPA